MAAWAQRRRGRYPRDRPPERNRVDDNPGRPFSSSKQVLVWPYDRPIFNVEQEAVGLSDANVDQWLELVHHELQGWEKECSCRMLNLSRNNIGDYAVNQIMDFFISQQISIETIKMYKNSIADDGLRSIGDLILHGAEPAVKEIHLSHNHITCEGALKMFHAVRHCKRYPSDGTSPLWLRMENNYIDWEPVRAEVKNWRDFSWVDLERRDAHRRHGSSCVPQLAMHRSYIHQTSSARGSMDLVVGSTNLASVDSSTESNAFSDNRSWAEESEADGDEDLPQWINDRVNEAADAQREKLNLVFDVLAELRQRQNRIEATLTQLGIRD